jgi:hypothetical protein
MSAELIEKIAVHNDNCIKGFFNEYRFLCNFHECPVVFENDTYRSTENAFQAAKEVWAERDKFFDCSPAESKKLGAEVKLNVVEWDRRKLGVMYKVVSNKFYQNDELREMLLATGDKYLEETNWWGDKYWGVCNGVGENHLGKILMEVRSQLRG